MAKLAQRLLEPMQGSKLDPRIAWLRTLRSLPTELWDRGMERLFGSVDAAADYIDSVAANYSTPVRRDWVTNP